MDGDSASRFALGCYGETGVVGYEFSACRHGLRISACSSTHENLMLFVYDALAAGTINAGEIEYTDSAGVAWEMVPGGMLTATFTRIECVGGVIEGHFSAILNEVGGHRHTLLSGSLHVCRVAAQQECCIC